MTDVRRSYLVCATQRSGSTLLCELLKDTGVAGRPEEYFEAVRARSLHYVGSLDCEDLDRVIDTRWDPPVTVGVRLISVVNDCTQHVGQMAYIRGLLAGRHWLAY